MTRRVRSGAIALVALALSHAFVAVVVAVAEVDDRPSARALAPEV